MACSKIPNCLLRILDYLIVCIFVSPLVIYYWQGTWILMDFYVFPDSFLDSAVLSTAVGVIFSHFMLVTQAWILEKLSNYHIMYLRIAWKICIYFTSIAVICFWRGVWMLMDRFAGGTLTILLVSHNIAFVFLTITRTTSSVIACPGYLLKDESTSQSTSFNFSAVPLIDCIKSKTLKRFISHFLTVFVISTAIVCYWRGAWNLGVYLTDLSIGTGLYNCVARTCFGYVVCFLCFLASQPLQKTLIEDLISWPYTFKAFLEHIFIYVLGFATINVWSGLWCLADHYFIIPGQSDNQLSAVLRHFVSVIGLYLAQGDINLVAAPAGCRTHGRDSLEGLFMGTYFIFTEPSGTGDRMEVTLRNATVIEPNENQNYDSGSNATQTKQKVTQ